jgi:hypothetical protein
MVSKKKLFTCGYETDDRSGLQAAYSKILRLKDLEQKIQAAIDGKQLDRDWTYLFTPDYLGQKIHLSIRYQ